jgi:Xaa-Pro aminopeptidase
MFEAQFQSFSEVSDNSQSVKRLADLRAQMKQLGVAGFLVPLADEHQGEYIPAGEQRLAWLTGFTGSAGMAVVLEDKAAILVDGRYTEQAAAQVKAELFMPVASFKTSLGEWLMAHAVEGTLIGYDPRLHTIGEIDRLSAVLARKKLQLSALPRNPIDVIWTGRPKPPSGSARLHPMKYAGQEAAAKIAEVRATLTKEGVGGLLVSDPHASAWLFNIRGSDVPHTPLPLCYSFVPQDGGALLFIDGRKLSTAMRDVLASIAVLHEPSELDAVLSKRVRGMTIRLDAATAGIRFKTLIEASGGKVENGADPIALMKARKNKIEIAGARTAHLRDGAAMSRFLCWFDGEVTKGKLTEIDAVAALETFRRETKALKDISFTTISAAGPHAALPHYRVSTASNAKIGKGIFLIDSGGQYEDGTTDITRTLAVGTPTPEMKDRFTRVLKGMIGLSLAVFPKGTSGAQIDAFARSSLWAGGFDFDHGTGHGIGSYLSVHEGPQRISKLGTVPLEAGMMLSNEPGYYKPGAYGIRIENLVVVEPRKIDGAEREMLGFETLTFAPIDRRLIDKALLHAEEKAWLNSYHDMVQSKIGPLVDATTRQWLVAACKPL